MDEQVDRLVQKVWATFQSTPTSSRLMIAVSGIPGSGKTSLAGVMAQRINALYAQQQQQQQQPPNNSAPPPAIFVPMDGYHLTRAQLAAMPDPELAAARRGAAFTFDGEKFLQLVRRLREPVDSSTTPTIYAPSFDHAVKDPVEDDIPIAATARVIFFEGNYLSLNKEPWNTAARLMDELWFVEVDFETARRRLIKRHVQAGIARDAADADRRARENDLVNGTEIVEHRMPVQEIIVSKEDNAWER